MFNNRHEMRSVMVALLDNISLNSYLLFIRTFLHFGSTGKGFPDETRFQNFEKLCFWIFRKCLCMFSIKQICVMNYTTGRNIISKLFGDYWVAWNWICIKVLDVFIILLWRGKPSKIFQQFRKTFFMLFVNTLLGGCQHVL